jgi:hypothetical protein
MDYVRTATTETSRQLTIVVHDASVSITDAEGGVLVLQTDDKKTDERAGNGLVKLTRRNHWDGPALVSDIEVENGPRITRNYALSPGLTQLRITITVDNSRAGRPSNLTRVYERPVEQ